MHKSTKSKYNLACTINILPRMTVLDSGTVITVWIHGYILKSKLFLYYDDICSFLLLRAAALSIFFDRSIAIFDKPWLGRIII